MYIKSTFQRFFTTIMILATLLNAAIAPRAAAQTPISPDGDCQPAWVPTFGAGQGFDGYVNASVVFDDGSGPALYLGGSFKGAGGVRTRNIAKWDGQFWTTLGGGTNQAVYSLAVFDDGTGPALYAGGEFTAAGGAAASHIAKWDGSSWSAVGSEQHVTMRSLVVFDDGAGAALYAGGGGLSVTIANGYPTPNFIAKWDGQSWSALGSGVDGTVLALSVFDDGSGPSLIAGGQFGKAGGIAANHIAAWNGSAWRPLGVGTINRVRALTVFDDGTGPALYVGSEYQSAFLTLGPGAAGIISRWDGQSWSLVGNSISPGLAVFALAVFDDGSGPALYAGGSFSTLGGSPVKGTARWDGQTWSQVGSATVVATLTLTVFDDGTGLALYAGVSFMSRWDGQLWSSLENGPNDAVKASTVFDDGSGPALYVGGVFTRAGGFPANHIAQWDGKFWSPLGRGMFNSVSALAVFDDGTGDALYAGAGSNHGFVAQGADATRSIASREYIAKWDGQSWSPLGGGIDRYVNALAVFDDGAGAALYAGGVFDTAGAGATPVIHIAKWDGQNWSPLGGGIDGYVNALVVFDNGSGPALYAGGAFQTAGGVDAIGMAKWDGLRWAPVGNGFSGIAKALTVFDDGSGLALYAAGEFTTAGGVSAKGVAKWNGSRWASLGNGLNGFVNTLSVYDDGSGSALYAGGDFSSAYGAAGNSIARWDGHTWSELGPGLLNTIVDTMTVFDDGAGPALFVGGRIFPSPSGDAYLTKWKGCASLDPADLDGDGVVNGADLGAMLVNWGPCALGGACGGDLDADGVVDAADLATLLANWG